LQLVVVRRDEFATFELLCRLFAGDPDVRVVWDRRSGVDRRQRAETPDSDRRSSDRRAPPKSWSHLNYFVAHTATA